MSISVLLSRHRLEKLIAKYSKALIIKQNFNISTEFFSSYQVGIFKYLKKK